MNKPHVDALQEQTQKKKKEFLVYGESINNIISRFWKSSIINIHRFVNQTKGNGKRERDIIPNVLQFHGKVQLLQ